MSNDSYYMNQIVATSQYLLQTRIINSESSMDDLICSLEKKIGKVVETLQASPSACKPSNRVINLILTLFHSVI